VALSDHGEPGMDNSKRPLNPDFVLNSRVIMARRFCWRVRILAAAHRVSMRRGHWDDYGFRAIIAPSFADIFCNNCFKNGLLPIVLDTASVDDLFQAVTATPGYHLKIDLEQQSITAPNGWCIALKWMPSQKLLVEWIG